MSCTRSMRALVALAVVAAALGARPALAEIFKCSAKDGTPLYQNFPCDIDSLGSMPSQPTVNAAPAAVTVPASTHGKPTGKVAEHAAPVAAALVKPTAAAGLKVGMTEEQVKTIIGEPREVLEDEPRSGRVYIWRYDNGQDVYFDVKRRLISVQPYSSQQ